MRRPVEDDIRSERRPALSFSKPNNSKQNPSGPGQPEPGLAGLRHVFFVFQLVDFSANS